MPEHHHPITIPIITVGTLPTKYQLGDPDGADRPLHGAGAVAVINERYVVGEGRYEYVGYVLSDVGGRQREKVIADVRAMADVLTLCLVDKRAGGSCPFCGKWCKLRGNLSPHHPVEVQGFMNVTLRLSYA